MSEQQKTYLGNGKAIKTDSGFSFLRFNLSPKDLEVINNWAKSNNGWCTIDVMKRKEPSEKGVTHYGVLNTWKPTKKPDISTGEVEDSEVPY